MLQLIVFLLFSFFITIKPAEIVKGPQLAGETLLQVKFGDNYEPHKKLKQATDTLAKEGAQGKDSVLAILNAIPIAHSQTEQGVPINTWFYEIIEAIKAKLNSTDKKEPAKKFLDYMRTPEFITDLHKADATENDIVQRFEMLKKNYLPSANPPTAGNFVTYMHLGIRDEIIDIIVDEILKNPLLTTPTKKINIVNELQTIMHTLWGEFFDISAGRLNSIYDVVKTLPADAQIRYFSNENIFFEQQPITKNQQDGKKSLHPLLVDALKQFNKYTEADKIKFAPLLITTISNENDLSALAPLIIELIDNKKLSIDAQDTNGNTMLLAVLKTASEQKAISSSQKQIVDALLANGANVNIPDKNEQTAIFYSYNLNAPDIVQKLIDAGANLLLKPKNRSLLNQMDTDSTYSATASNYHLSESRKLIMKEFLYQAIKNKNLTAITNFEEKGNVNLVKDGYRETFPLIQAAQVVTGDDKLVYDIHLLTIDVPDTNLTNRVNSKTALEYAVESNNYPAFAFLLGKYTNSGKGKETITIDGSPLVYLIAQHFDKLFSDKNNLEKYKGILQKVLDAKPNIATVNAKNQNLLHILAQNTGLQKWHKDLIQQIITYVKTTNDKLLTAEDTDKKTPAVLAQQSTIEWLVPMFKTLPTPPTTGPKPTQPNIQFTADALYQAIKNHKLETLFPDQSQLTVYEKNLSTILTKDNVDKILESSSNKSSDNNTLFDLARNAGLVNWQAPLIQKIADYAYAHKSELFTEKDLMGETPTSLAKYFQNTLVENALKAAVLSQKSTPQTPTVLDPAAKPIESEKFEAQNPSHIGLQQVITALQTNSGNNQSINNIDAYISQAATNSWCKVMLLALKDLRDNKGQEKPLQTGSLYILHEYMKNKIKEEMQNKTLTYTTIKSWLGDFKDPKSMKDLIIYTHSSFVKYMIDAVLPYGAANFDAKNISEFMLKLDRLCQAFNKLIQVPIKLSVSDSLKNWIISPSNQTTSKIEFLCNILQNISDEKVLKLLLPALEQFVFSYGLTEIDQKTRNTLLLALFKNNDVLQFMGLSNEQLAVYTKIINNSDLSAVDNLGKNVLHYIARSHALMQNNATQVEEIIKAALAQNKNIFAIKDAQHKTPIDLATSFAFGTNTKNQAFINLYNKVIQQQPKPAVIDPAQQQAAFTNIYGTLEQLKNNLSNLVKLLTPKKA